MGDYADAAPTHAVEIAALVTLYAGSDQGLDLMHVEGSWLISDTPQ